MAPLRAGIRAETAGSQAVPLEIVREVSEMYTFMQRHESRFRGVVTRFQQGRFLVNPEFPAKSVTQAEAKEATQLIYNLSSHLVSQRHTNLGRQASHKNQEKLQISRAFFHKDPEPSGEPPRETTVFI